MMIKPRFAGAIAFALLAANFASGQQSAVKTATSPPATANTPASAVVLKVGNKNVTKEEIDYLLTTLSPQAQKEVESRGKRSVGDQYAVMMILYQAGVGQHLDQSDQYHKDMTQHRRQLLAQLEYQDLLSKVQVTQPEVSAYYASHPEEFREAQVRQVAIRLKPATGSATDPGLTLEQAQTKANEIRGALASGMDPAKVAQQYSVPNEVRVTANPQTIADSPQLPPFVKDVFSLGIGQFTKPTEASGALVMLQVTGQSKMPLTDATASIEQALRQQKMEAQIAAMKSQAKIWMDQGYFGSEPASSSTAPPGNSVGPTGSPKP
ncbi:MAG TPA: peptidyl-prolyl cis-trans isomerase [Terriglobia bacterium]|nr:peptidyl-prolyl cis-trans isomerase [Terriglobia bacterium]